MEPAVLHSQHEKVVGFSTSQQQYYPAPTFRQESTHSSSYYKEAPPPYYVQPSQGTKYAPVPAQMQTSSLNVVIVDQPTVPTVTAQIGYPIGDHFLTLSITLTVICCVLGTWYSLLCTVPAIVFAIMARDAESHGDLMDAHSKARIALILNIASLMFWIFGLVTITLTLGAVFSSRVTSASNSGEDCNSNSYAEYQYCDM